MKLEKVSILNSQSVSSESIGSWKASLNSPILVKDVSSLANLSAVTIYRVVTVLVCLRIEYSLLERIDNLIILSELLYLKKYLISNIHS